MPAGFRRTIFITVFIFFIGLSVLGFVARRLPKTPEPEIPLYPDHQLLKPYALEATGVQVVFYRVPLDYPSTRVLDFYSKQLSSLGYSVDPPGNVPDWQPEAVTKDSRKLTLKQNWIGPDRLRVLQLEISATEKFTRDPENDRLIDQEIEPGLQVSVFLSRKAILGEGPVAPSPER